MAKEGAGNSGAGAEPRSPAILGPFHLLPITPMSSDKNTEVSVKHLE